jgi:hypothetical protein
MLALPVEGNEGRPNPIEGLLRIGGLVIVRIIRLRAHVDELANMAQGTLRETGSNPSS